MDKNILNNTDSNLLGIIANFDSTPIGAYNVRKNGQSVQRSSTENVTITSKTDKAGIDIFIKPGTNHTIKQKNDMKVIDLKFFVYGDDLNSCLQNTPTEFQLDDISFMKMMFLFIAKEGIDGKAYCNEVTNSVLKLLLAKIVHKFNESSISTPHDYQVLFLVYSGG